MQLNLHNTSDHLAVRSFDGETVVIGTEAYSHSVMFTPQGSVESWSAERVGDLGENDYQRLLADTPEVVILGTGPTLVFPDPRVLARFHGQGVGLEVMTNDAACRTYNVLASEGRVVRAALLIASA